MCHRLSMVQAPMTNPEGSPAAWDALRVKITFNCGPLPFPCPCRNTMIIAGGNPTQTVNSGPGSANAVGGVNQGATIGTINQAPSAAAGAAGQPEAAGGEPAAPCFAC